MDKRIEPLSYNAFAEQYGEGVDRFTIYCLGYWLQQNQDKADTKSCIHLKGHYEQHQVELTAPDTQTT